MDAWTDPVTGTEWAVDISWTEVQGRQEPLSVTIAPAAGAAGLNAEVMRRVPWGGIFRDARARISDGIRTGEIYTSSGLGPADRLAERFAPARGRSRSTEELEAVAEVYRDAWHRGESPTRAVSSSFQISYSTAAKRVAAARRGGHLPPAEPGKAKA